MCKRLTDWCQIGGTVLLTSQHEDTESKSKVSNQDPQDETDDCHIRKDELDRHEILQKSEDFSISATCPQDGQRGTTHLKPESLGYRRPIAQRGARIDVAREQGTDQRRSCNGANVLEDG